MFYNQPLANRFGNDLIDNIKSGRWTHIDIAVAWVRESGIRHLKPALKSFLESGNSVRFIVGLDFDNTSKDGLESLLSLGAHGHAKSFVYHNEAHTVFHPKIYLFTNAAEANLIVASNNITESGLYRNVEAGLNIEMEIEHPTFTSALDAINTWSDESTGLAKLLDHTLLAKLEENGYVKAERILNLESKRQRASEGNSQSGAKRERIFASVATTPPPPPNLDVDNVKDDQPSAVTPSSNESSTNKLDDATGQVLLMRVRKAHALDRPTQTQLPKNVAMSPFFGGRATSVISAHSGESHRVSEAKARGMVNTLKLEIPEMRNMNDPVVRFEKSSGGIHYQVYDRNTPQGNTIMKALEAGLTINPPSTTLTKPASPDSSTWWRFI